MQGLAKEVSVEVTLAKTVGRADAGHGGRQTSRGLGITEGEALACR